YGIGLPQAGVWTEILNTDSSTYDGDGKFGNLGQVIAREVSDGGWPARATVSLPPLGSVWLRYSLKDTLALPGDPGVE
ncbi:MAG TPA: alpha amylase C-terminal domain-containing protein, partial [Propionibacteriaceae bacterium]|nr:alpha amylase C-terminal domain-containing protein [Propionibacteriaceae bacterium]